MSQTNDQGLLVKDASANTDGIRLRGSDAQYSSKRVLTITPSDSTVLDPPVRALYVGGTGNLTIETVEGDQVLFAAVPVGMIVPVQCRKVLSTGTAASLILGLV